MDYQQLLESLRAHVKPDVFARVHASLEQVRQSAGYFEGITPSLTVENAAEKAVMTLYGGIGPMGITAEEFTGHLDTIKARAIELRINSPGGEVFSAVTMYNALRRHPARVDVDIDGLAASAAGVVAMAGDSRSMRTGSQFMVHEAHGAFGLVYGNAKALRAAAQEFIETAAIFDKFSEGLADIYAERTGRSREFWLTEMAGTETTGESWYSPKQALDKGLATAISKASAEIPASFVEAAAKAYAHSPLHIGPKPEVAAVATEPDWRKEARQKIAGAMEGLYAHAG